MCSPQSGPLREDSWSYREETREEGDRLPGGEKGESKGVRERNPSSNQFPKCSPKPGTHKEIHRVE